MPQILPGPALRQGRSERSACLQVLAMVPISQYVASFYGHHSGFCNMLINTAFSLAAALFVFVILPAGDLILGEEPPEAVGYWRQNPTDSMAFECPRRQIMLHSMQQWPVTEETRQHPCRMHQIPSCGMLSVRLVRLAGCQLGQHAERGCLPSSALHLRGSALGDSADGHAPCGNHQHQPLGTAGWALKSHPACRLWQPLYGDLC